MMIVRSAKITDLDAIYDLAKMAGVGMTTLPRDEGLLSKKLQLSHASHAKTIKQITDEYYLFVFEDTDNKRIVGTSAIEAAAGYEAQFYSYKISSEVHHSESLQIDTKIQHLSLSTDNTGFSELCSLYLEPTYRKDNNGALLSRARLLFIAQSKNRFTDKVIADIRGVSTHEGKSPFWDAVGAHFFKMSFAEADRLTSWTDKQFIKDLMPKESIYIHMLPKEAQEVIGKPHPYSLPAMKLLTSEGFYYNEYVDIFDAGPTIEAPLSKIKTINQSFDCHIDKIVQHLDAKPYLLSNAKIDFRATLAPVLLDEARHHCIVDQNTADALQVQVGDSLRAAPF